jgi:hypothetical protein
MAIVTCDHHSGMGLCSECSREMDREEQRERGQQTDHIRRGARTLLEAAGILERAGRHHLAQQIRDVVPR